MNKPVNSVKAEFVLEKLEREFHAEVIRTADQLFQSPTGFLDRLVARGEKHGTDGMNALEWVVYNLRKEIDECHERRERSSRKFHRNPGRWIRRKLGLSKK